MCYSEDMKETHYLLDDLKPGQETLALWALEALVKISRLHSCPISREQAEEWLSEATEKEPNRSWVNWRIDGIFE